jgi:hypothetical protein
MEQWKESRQHRVQTSEFTGQAANREVHIYVHGQRESKHPLFASQSEHNLIASTEHLIAYDYDLLVEFLFSIVRLTERKQRERITSQY